MRCKLWMSTILLILAIGTQIGVGMISRGEVALIVAEKGLKVGIMPEELFSPIVIVVVITTLLTPILLRIVFADKEEQTA